eukprot:7951476-Pyramimonas_sp.AAC.1
MKAIIVRAIDHDREHLDGVFGSSRWGWMRLGEFWTRIAPSLETLPVPPASHPNADTAADACLQAV